MLRLFAQSRKDLLRAEAVDLMMVLAVGAAGLALGG